MKRIFCPPIDPQKIRKIDAVLCTHSHSDHMDPWTLECIQPSFIFISTERAYRNNPVSLESREKVFLTLGKSVQVNEIEIRFFPAAHYHLFDDSGSPDCISFLLSIGNRTLFFWGDGVIYADLIPSLKTIRFDYFFAPINGRDWFREQKGIIGNITARELSELCSLLDISTLIPNHFDLFDYNGESLEYFQYCMKRFSPEQHFQILKAGDFIEVYYDGQ